MPISLKPHNLKIYPKVKEFIEKYNKACVIQPPGTGKMFIGLKLAEDNKEKRILYLAPYKAILHAVKKNIFREGMTMENFPNLKRMTYNKLASLSDEEIEKLEVDIIIEDEFHHCGAPEYEKGVKRLVKRNPNAKILGLSATPIRYNDGFRDMAEEMFEDCVASEMTLEEAIDSGILPEDITYVSTLYGYEQELIKSQADIDKMKDSEENKKEAQKLLDELRNSLDENTENLPELFSKYMNPSGKYIVFCKNIDDMNEKMAQAQKMFGKVNSNIKVRGVSSKIREADKILKEFEQDNEEGTLKLLYAVDMISEGYHVKDLDGVVMMRPTRSPRVFIQQLGRGLTVGNNKKIVIFDLVNNFDTCKVIEEFVEKIREHRGREGSNQEDRKSSKFSIFDTTKKFRKIAEKITALTKRKTTSLAEKIEIFEEFMKTGEELDGNTIYDGYPIGQWAIQIRNGLNNGKNGKINPTEEQLGKLESMRILERRIDSTIDEKIDSLVKWIERYPKLTIIPKVEDTKLRDFAEEYAKKYAEKAEEFEIQERIDKIQKEYEKMQRYYAYVRTRKSQEKLTDEQENRCKEGGVGGVFGYSTEVENLAQKYGVSEEEIYCLLAEFGTLDNFYEMHEAKKINNIDYINLAGKIIKNVVDIDSDPNRGYDDLYRAISGINPEETGVYFYSSKKLNDALENNLEENRKKVIKSRYGLTEDKKRRTLEDIGIEIGTKRERARQIWVAAVRELRNPRILRNFNNTFRIDDDELSDTEKEQIKERIKDIQLGNGISSEKLDEIKKIQEDSRNRIEQEKREALRKQIIESKELPLEEIKSLTYGDLLDLGIDPKLATEISSKIEEYNAKQKQNNVLDMNIAELELSVRAYNVLHRAKIYTVGDLANMTPKELEKVRNLGRKCYQEVLAKMKECGVSLKTEELSENDEKPKEKTDSTSLTDDKAAKPKNLNDENTTQRSIKNIKNTTGIYR